MKKVISKVLPTLAFPVAAITLGACSADEMLNPGTSADGGNTVIEAICAAPQGCDENGSRTAVDPTEYTSGQIGVNWLPGDKIGVYGNKGTANAPFTNQSTAETDKTTFAGNLADGESPVYAYYPYSETAGSDHTALTGTLPLTQHYSTATRELEGDWKVGTPYAGSTSEFRFRHIFAFFKFDINAGGTEIAGEKLQSISLTIEGAQLGGDFTYDMEKKNYSFTPLDGADCVTCEWTDTPALTASTFNGYVNVAPNTGLSGKNIDIVITTNYHIIKFSQVCKANRLDANTYYTIPLELAKFKDQWTIEENPDAPKEENAAWVPGLNSRLACANTVYAVEGQPFMHKIRVPQSSSQTYHAVVPVKDGIERAYNLPEGLTWNAERCLVQGTAPAAGDYTYSVEFTSGGTTYKEGIKLHVAASAADLLSPTPMMGWQTWNVLDVNISYDNLSNQLAGMQAKGLIDAGYKYFGIDDGWQYQSLNDNGHQIPDANKFPTERDGVNVINGIQRMANKIHEYGLKAGIYTDCGTKTCAKYFASYGYEDLHAQDYKEWGYDFVKEDWYYALDMAPTGATSSTFKDGYSGLTSYWNTPSMALELYTKMGTALKSRGLMLYMCEWGLHDPWKWGAETGATCWRVTYDLRDCWWGAIGNSKNNDQNANGIGLHNTIVLMRNLWPYVGINRYNDADMICVGIRGTGKATNECVYGTKGLTNDEAETSFAMWCMWSSPILLGFDMTKDMTSSELSHDLALVKNAELIAINQDPMGQGAEWVKTVGNVDYYMKDLANGDVAVAVVNLGDSQASYSVDLKDYEALDANSSYSVRDLIGQKDAGSLSASSSLTGSLKAHATYIVRLKKQ